MKKIIECNIFNRLKNSTYERQTGRIGRASNIKIQKGSYTVITITQDHTGEMDIATLIPILKEYFRKLQQNTIQGIQSSLQ